MQLTLVCSYNKIISDLITPHWHWPAILHCSQHVVGVEWALDLYNEKFTVIYTAYFAVTRMYALAKGGEIKIPMPVVGKIGLAIYISRIQVQLI
jgi:hypothetical protein